MPFGTEDAAIFVRDGKTANTAVGSAKVHLDFPEDVEQFASVSAKVGQVAGRPRITYATADLPGLAHGTAVEIEGVNYKANSPRQLDDGVMSVAELARG